MYTPGKLIYFDLFFLKTVIQVNQSIFSFKSGTRLPSIVNHLPQDQIVIHGCLEIPDACINCYVFEKKRPTTRTGWSFPLDTLLYDNWLNDFPLESLLQNYPIAGVDYEIIGELTDDELQKVIHCFSASATVKRKYKKWL